MSDNDNNVTMLDIAMLDVTMDTDDITAPIVDTTPTVYDFTAEPAEDRARIIDLINEIGLSWSTVSPASPFPYRFHPDPDTHNWGIELLSALEYLASMTKAHSSYKDQAVLHVCSSIEERNEGLSIIHGDYVIRTEDIHYATRKMRNRVNSYRPDRADDRRSHMVPSRPRQVPGRCGRERRHRR